MIPVIVAMSLVNLAIFSIYMAAASFASTQADLGVKITIGEAYRLAWWRGSRYLWLLTLCYLYAFLPLLLIELSFFAVASLFIHSGAGVDSALFLLIPLAVLLVVAAMVYGVLMALRLSLAFPACVQENLTAYAAIKRSFQLTRGAKGRIFLVILVIYALLYAGILVVEIAAAFLAAIGVFAAMALHVHLSPPWSYIGLGLLAVCGLAALILFVSLTYAAMMTGLAVIYNDQRLRKDGLPPAPLPAGAAV
jgi:membrane-anchored glycerophosphoryl diester phosphodiesterase (GDPDase)